MSATCYKIACSESSLDGSFAFELRLVPERHVDVGVYGSDGLVTGLVRTDPTSLYNVIHGWPVEAQDDRAGHLRVSEQYGVVTIRYERSEENLRFESRVSSEDFARRVHSLGGPQVM